MTGKAEIDRDCAEFLAKHDACALECKHYRECITWENYVASMERAKRDRKKKRGKKPVKKGLDAFL